MKSRGRLAALMLAMPLSTTAQVSSLQLTLKSSRAASALVHTTDREIATMARRLSPIDQSEGCALFTIAPVSFAR